MCFFICFTIRAHVKTYVITLSVLLATTLFCHIYLIYVLLMRHCQCKHVIFDAPTKAMLMRRKRTFASNIKCSTCIVSLFLLLHGVKKRDVYDFSGLNIGLCFYDVTSQ